MQEKNTYTKYEKARLIGSRALQISSGAPMLVKLSKEELEKMKYDPLEIATKEFEEGMIPMEVKRPAPIAIKKKKLEEGQKAVDETQ